MATLKTRLKIFLSINLIVPLYVMTVYSDSFYHLSGKLFISLFFYTWLTLCDIAWSTPYESK